jgi:hypothetical protein
MSSRRLAQDLSHPLITMLQQECTRATCPEMKAGEWMYLCVAHGNDGAMEASLIISRMEKKSSLTAAAAMLRHRLHSAHRGQRNRAPELPTRVPITVRVTLMPSLSPGLTFSLACRISIPAPSHRHFGSLARRLGRIFAHAYFHHREVFEQAEAESSLYARFLALTCKFDLVPPEFLIIPTPSMATDDPEPPRLLAAAVDPQHLPGPEDDGDDRGRGVHRGLGVEILGGIDRNPSPRKGRHRTGTMIFSEALIMAEELGKGAHSPSPERESIEQMSSSSNGMHDSESDFVHVDVSSRGEEEEHDSYMGVDPGEHSQTYDLDPPEEDHHLATIPDIHADVEATEDHQDHQAPEQDVTDDAELEDAVPETRGEPADEDPEHDVTSAHEASGTTIIELPPADDLDVLEGDAQEEDLTEAVVEPHDDEDDEDDEDDDAAEAQEVEQIAFDEPQDQVDDA